jgi:hypothetical protein
MINLEIVFSVLIGGILSLLGTLLANLLQSRSEQRRLKTELAKERLAEVRRYISTCLEFVDLVSIPTTLGSKNFGKDAFAEWIKNVDEHLEKWRDLPASGSARVLLVADKEILEELAQIDKLRIRFYLNYLDMIDKGKMIQLDDKREELKEIAIKAGQRLDKILDDI